jgi:maltooligosyltrehalose trehalohydrolase
MKLGAWLEDTRCGFRVWAPLAREVAVEIDDSKAVPLRAAEDGYHVGSIDSVRAGQRYRYLLDGERLPDPCSRFLPEGPHGPSEIVDASFAWTDAGWRGLPLAGLVMYEMHVGTFTPEGTLAAAAEKLAHLKSVGINAVELMPLAECPGRFNWGYDGVAWFAPSHNYGGYDALKRFVDRAHALGMAVVLDVVYNHLGPDGNYLRRFSPHYLGSISTEWGEAINFDGEQSAPVRELVIANACEWIREFHLDGLRLDATQSIFDRSDSHLLAELVTAARATAPDRHVLVISENEPQRASNMLPATEGGFGLDAMWNDDFHHTAVVAATGRRDAYYHDYLGTAQEFVSTAKRGFLFQGQYYRWQKQARGQPMQVPSSRCVAFLENHDQVANSVTSRRLHRLCSPGVWRALTATLLLGPQTPLLFMGQEFGASAPFRFFADHQQPLRGQVQAGRLEFMTQFPGSLSADARECLPDPGDEQSFQCSKLDWSECREGPALRLHRDLLRLRREDPVISRQGSGGFDGAVLGQRAFLLRWFDAAEGDRLLVVNLGDDIVERPMPEPLLAPPRGGSWALLWSSEHAAYDGGGTLPLDPAVGWQLPGQSATLWAASAPEAAA